MVVERAIIQQVVMVRVRVMASGVFRISQRGPSNPPSFPPPLPSPSLPSPPFCSPPLPLEVAPLKSS